MTNRTGKRERQARNQHKRCMATLRIGGVVRTLKVGRKKENSLHRSELGQDDVRVFDYLSPAHRLASWAVPVADSRKPVKTDERDEHVSELESSPAP